MKSRASMFLPTVLVFFSQTTSAQQIDDRLNLPTVRQSQAARTQPGWRAGPGPDRNIETQCDFESNFGQADPQVRFLARGRNHTLFLTTREVVLSPVSVRPFHPDDKTKSVDRGALRIRFQGSRPDARLEGFGELPGKKHYLVKESTAKSINNVPTWASVRYQDLYPGVDIVFRRKKDQFEFDVIVAPGTDPQVVRLRFNGALRTVVSAQGDLEVETSGGMVRFNRPSVYQETDGVKMQVASWYRLRHAEVSFGFGPYDRSRSVVIDPALSCSTYLGGSSSNGNDAGNAIAVDPAGYIYVAGETGSADFPTANAIYPRCPMSPHGACNEGFVTKLDPRG